MTQFNDIISVENMFTTNNNNSKFVIEHSFKNSGSHKPFLNCLTNQNTVYPIYCCFGWFISVKILSTTILKVVYFDSSIGIGWKLITVQLFHYSTALFIMIQATAYHRQELKINHKPGVTFELSINFTVYLIPVFEGNWIGY